MLRTVRSLDVFKQELRRRVCMHCRYRPQQSESLGPEVVRPCELACPVFVHLPVLRQTALLRDPMICSRPECLGRKIDQILGGKTHPAGGESALSRNRAAVIRAVLTLVDDL